MSSGANRADVLAAERAVNERYRAQMRIELERLSAAVAQHTSLSRNSIWANGTISAGKHRGEIHPVVGRVAMVRADCPVAGELYIGPQILELDGELTVVSWAAPVAQLFYAGRRCGDPAARAVLGRRTFTTKGTDLTDYVDDLESDAKNRVVFALGGGRSVIEVPTAPVPTRRPRPRPIAMSNEVAPPDLASPPEHEARPGAADFDAISNGEPVETTTIVAPAADDTGAIDRAEIRAEQAVLDIVQRPRTGELVSVLATLQPDQYEFVTWPADQPLIVSGQPGTGKTVIAMHRAGYLTHPDRPGGALDRVVVIGPTDEYRDHVRHVSESVGGASVPVSGLPSFLARLAQINVGHVAPGPNDRIGVDWSLWSVVHKAARAAGVHGVGDVNAYRALVKELVTDSEIHRTCVDDPEVSSWLKRVGSFERASSHQRYLPFLAATGLAVMGYGNQRVDHLIVDEAQDVPPLVWQILLSLVRKGGSVSLFGDMNQRRSDWTANSWEQLAIDLELTDDDGVAPLRTLSIGYRTTRQILKFANQLLPRSERTIHALRAGVPPRVQRVAPSKLVEEVVRAADELSRRYPTGLTAVITTEPQPITDAFRNTKWERGTFRDSWKRDGRTVCIYHPDRARGLEFDGVVVVEPGAFPQNVGRDGVLYTSLTRATQELTVLYSGALPKNLRPPK